MEKTIEHITRPADFDGVFRFTNASDEDFAALWNNKEYLYPAHRTCPMIIEGETLESIQEIRKRFAKKYAEREYMKTKAFQKIKNGDGRSVLSTYNQSELQPYIDQCLEPLPLAEVTIRRKKTDSESDFKGTKPVGKRDNLNAIFKDEEIQELGEMPS